MKALAIAGTDLRRLVRWRPSLFFLFALPMLIILVLGAAFGSQSVRVAVAAGDSGALGRELVAGLDATPGVDVRRVADEGAVREAVERADADAGLVVPRAYDATLRAGGRVALRYLQRPDALDVRASVESAAARQATRLRAIAALGTADAAEDVAAVAGTVPRVAVRVVDPDGGPYTETVGRFDESAATQLVLFVFLTSLNGAIWLIETRRLGVSRRLLSTPTSGRTILLGTALGRFAVALAQAGLIMGGAALLFGVDWGDPLGAAAIVLALALVSTGAAMLLGAAASSEQQAGPLALLLGLVLAALGGSMVPLEVFPEGMRRIAHLTPHAWANDGFAELLRHGGGLADLGVELGVLVAYGTALLAASTWLLRRRITG
ncbi:MAG TPA: ABC transporter permease [Gaiellaceae bacterium]|nr:ABC transporter permease [Gaiellaceae bacterium]